MKKLTVKDILDMEAEELEKMMTEEQYDRMRKLNIQYVWQLLDLLQDSARLSGQEEDEEHVTIDEYLEYLEDKRD